MRQTRRRGLGVLEVYNPDPVSGTNPSYPGAVLHSTLWLQESLNKLGFCVGDEDSILGRQTTEGFRLWALSKNVSPEISSVNDRVVISAAASEALQAEKLPKVGICVGADRESGVTETRPRAAPSSTGVPSTDTSNSATSLTLQNDAGVPTWAWWVAGGVLVLGLGAALFYSRKGKR